MSTLKKQIFTVPMLLLVILIVLFHTELFVIGVRIYAALAQSPRSERLLGDYYTNASEQNANLARSFYFQALDKFKNQLNSATPQQKAMIQIRVGRLYECGKGLPIDLVTAKQWYTDASQTANSANDKNLQATAEEAIKRVSGSTPANPNASPCAYQSDIIFIKKTLNPENAY